MSKKKKDSKASKKSKPSSIWEKINKHLSDVFDEEDLKEDISEEDEELEIDISFDFVKDWIKRLKKYDEKNRLISPIHLIHFIVIISVFILIYILTQTETQIGPYMPPTYTNGTYFDEEGNQVYDEAPFVIYNPNTHNARLIIKEKVFIRFKKEYGIYVDLIYSFPDNQSVTKEEMENVIIYEKNNVTAYVGEERPYKNGFTAITHASILINKQKDIWYSDKFKFNPLDIEHEVLIIVWGSKQEFPDGTISVAEIFKSEKI